MLSSTRFHWYLASFGLSQLLLGSSFAGLTSPAWSVPQEPSAASIAQPMAQSSASRTTEMDRRRSSSISPLAKPELKRADSAGIAPSDSTAHSASALGSPIELGVAITPELLNQPQLNQPTQDWLSQQPGDSTQTGDSELGILQIRESPDAPFPKNELGQQNPPPTQPACDLDPELGCIRVQPTTPVPSPSLRQPFLYLLARFDYFRSDNILSLTDPVGDGLIRPGLTLIATPRLGPRTYLVTSIDGNLVRYSTQSAFDYNELRFRAGIFQQLSPNMFGEFGWSHQQLFIAGDDLPGLPSGTRFFSDHGLRLELSRRDQLSERLSLNSFYQFRLGFADPADRSRVSNVLVTSLSYNIQPTLQVGLDYQFALTNFTQQKREDLYQQITARLTLTAFRNTQFNIFGGYSFGSSTAPGIDFNGTIWGVSLSTNLNLL